MADHGLLFRCQQHPTEPPAAARRASGERDEQGSPPAIVKTEPGQQQQQSQGQARREAGTASSTPHAAKPGAAPPQVRRRAWDDDPVTVFLMKLGLLGLQVKQQQEEEQRAGRLPDYMLKAMVQKLYLQTPGEAEEVKRARVAARKALFDVSEWGGLPGGQLMLMLLESSGRQPLCTLLCGFVHLTRPSSLWWPTGALRGDRHRAGLLQHGGVEGSGRRHGPQGAARGGAGRRLQRGQHVGMLGLRGRLRVFGNVNG